MTIIISVQGSICPSYFPRVVEKIWRIEATKIEWYSLVNGSMNFSLFNKTILKLDYHRLELSFHCSKIYITKYTTLAVF